MIWLDWLCVVENCQRGRLLGPRFDGFDLADHEENFGIIIGNFDTLIVYDFGTCDLYFNIFLYIWFSQYIFDIWLKLFIMEIHLPYVVKE